MTVDTSPRDPHAERAGSILVVDDEPDLVSTLCELLAAHGFAAKGAATGTEAIEALRAGGYDILLADLNLPGLDGIGLLEAGLALDPNLAGIIMTGRGTLQSAVDAMKLGAFEYVVKPIRIDDLLPTLRRAIELRRLREENLQLREMAAIHELSLAIAGSLDLESVLDRLADATMNQGDADEVSVMLRTQEDDLLLAVVRGPGRDHLVGERFAIGRGIAGWVARNLEPLVLRGLVDDPRLEVAFPRPEIGASLSIPMVAGGRLVGVLNVNATRSRRPFTPGQVRGVQVLASIGAAAIERSRLHLEAREAEAKYRSIFENLVEGVYQASLDGRLLAVNPAFARIFGFDSPETVLRVSPAARSFLDPSVEVEFQRQMTQNGSVRDLEVRIRRRDGAETWVSFNVRRVQDDAGNPVCVEGSVVDVSARKRAEEALRRQLETLSVLYAWTRRLSAFLDTQRLAECVVCSAVEDLGVRFAWLGWSDSDGRVRGEAHAPFNFECAHRGTTSWEGRFDGADVAARAVRTGRPVVATDLAASGYCTACAKHAEGIGVSSVAAFPLESRRRVLGVLVTCAQKPGFFTEDRVALIETCARQAAVALENSRLYAEAAQNLARVEAVRAIDLAITSSIDLRVTLDVFLTQVTNRLDANAADILLHDPNLHVLQCAASRGFRRVTTTRPPVRFGEGHAGRAALERKPVVVTDLTVDPGEFQRVPGIQEEELRTCFAVPLIAKGHVRGVMELFYRTVHEPDAEWMAFLDALAGQAAIAIDNAAMFDDLQRSHDDLALAYETTLEGWVKALDLRDKETEGHTERVTEMTLRLAKALGITGSELAHVRRGALLHDIGKMGIPDAILLKPGPLTPDEWVVMKRHPVYAFELLSPIAYLRGAMDIPYGHHERWDGTGYPRGLKGDAIPLAARMFAPVDVWDALASDRPYRAAWPMEKVRAYLVENAGTQFDPRIVDAFLPLLAG